MFDHLLTSSTRTDSIPVRYVFPKRSFDVEASAEALFDVAMPSISAKGKEKEVNVLVVWDVGYDWMAGEPGTRTACSALV
jgi:hypothetical protein